MELQDPFVTKNNLRLRSHEELVAKFIELQSMETMLDFKSEVLVNYLTFEDAKPYLSEEFRKEIESGSGQWQQITSIEKCVAEFLNYMEFAWGKAQDRRGISASRNIDKLGMWLWIMNREDLQEILDDDDLYNPYGAPALVEVCNQLGIEVPSSLIEFAKNKLNYGSPK